MTLSLPIATAPLCGSVELAGDKSLAHRAALFAALAEGRSTLTNFPDSGVARAMLRALATLGVEVILRGDALTVVGNGFRAFPNAGVTVDCGNSATTMRLLAGALAGTQSEATLTGSAGLCRRPMDRIVDPLRKMGAAVSSTPSVTADGSCVACAPLALRPAALRGIAYDLPVASAQVLSCLQLAALGASSPSVLRVPGPVRDHTRRMLAAQGVSLSETEVSPLAAPLKPLDARLPGDISSAAFLFAAAAIVPGSAVTVRGLGVNPTRTGVLDVLSAMGAKVTRARERVEMGEPVADVTVAAAPLRAVTVGGETVVRAIDEFPALAAVAAFAEGTTRVADARELRFKETDRIAAIVTQLRALGARVTERDDGFEIVGGTLTGGTARANGDHRLAMAMAVCGLRRPVAVDGAEILSESFPTFPDVMKSLGIL